ncbi:hypothetical protein Tco_0224201, partial [Tanacetum coccineum]
IDKGRRYKRRKETKGKKVVSSLDFQEDNTGTEKINTAGEVNAASIEVNTASKVNTMILVGSKRLLGKDLSNPFMVDNLPKIVWYSMHHSIHTEAWLLQSKRLAGKELSNPLMVARLPKTGWYSFSMFLLG